MRKAAAGLRGRIAPILIFSLALFLRLFRLGLDGLGNLYYAAGVQSMLAGWHNFLFASFDPAGFVSIDKPPLGFWVQAVSVRLFGFHGWALILPQALAGALSTLVLYYLVKRTFGASAGLAAALILAVTPVSVATHRSNTPDGQLTLLLLLAAVCAVKAAESGRLRWLLGAAALVGLGFNVKMLQAYLVVPALFIFLPPPLPIFKRLGQLALAMLVLISISFAWPAFVDLTPASQRPYVGSTVSNHVYELAVVHNGVRRLGPIAAWLGIRARGAPPPAVAEVYSAGAAMPASRPISTRTWPDGGPPEVGQPGPLRLFNPQMAGQASWLLPIALAALITGLARSRWIQPLGRETLFYSLWAGWLIPALFFFSYGGLI
ncbi:MAG TPA: glycosyltransferase family 39 protein, partial [Anaerolineales bacterium]